MRRTPRYEIRLAVPFADNLMNSVAHCTELPINVERQASLYPSSASTWNSLWVWEACFVADTHAMESLWVWEACFVADTHAVKSLWVWEACFVADTHAMESLWVWEACFVADTHAVKSLRVWEACFVADTQIVKTERYNKETIYSKMFVVGVLYFGSIQKKMSCEILKLL